MAKVPEFIQRSRDRWEYRGQKRPSFAIPPLEGQESVWDYPRPPELKSDNRPILVASNGVLIAQTTNAIRILETASPPTVYIPQEDIRMEFLKKASGSSLCEWKGIATYWDVILPSQTFTKVGWSYTDPYEEFTEIAGYLSFYPSILECSIAGEKVLPQPGGFYGGWVTAEIVGPVKGEIPEASL